MKQSFPMAFIIPQLVKIQYLTLYCAEADNLNRMQVS
jgi:hypothetical protein